MRCVRRKDANGIPAPRSSTAKWSRPFRWEARSAATTERSGCREASATCWLTPKDSCQEPRFTAQRRTPAQEMLPLRGGVVHREFRRARALLGVEDETVVVGRVGQQDA